MISLYQILTPQLHEPEPPAGEHRRGRRRARRERVLELLLIPRYGIVGAAVSTAISYTLAALILLTVFVRESGSSLRGDGAGRAPTTWRATSGC